MNKDKPRLGRGLASLLGDVVVRIEPNEGENIRKDDVDADVNVHRQTSLQQGKQQDKQQAETKATHNQNQQLQDITSDHKSDTATRLIPINRVDGNPYQPRTQIDEKELEKLTESIKLHGVIQPIVVRPKGERYQLVAGQRRLEAAKALNINAIPAVIRDVTDQELLEIALIENIHREDLNCIDRALAYKKYQETFQLTTEQAAERLGQDRTTVTNYVRLLSLPEQIIELLRANRLSMGHARAIAGLEKEEEQIKLAFRVVQQGLSVRQTEQLVSHIKSPKSSKKAIEKSPNILDLEQQMTRALSTKVQIIPSRKKGTGKVIIEYYSLDDFDRILEHICGAEREEL